MTAYGEIRRGQHGGEIIHSEYYIISERSQDTLTTALTPVPELLPPELSDALMSLAEPLRMLHRPPTEISLDDLALGRPPGATPAAYRRAVLAHHLIMLAVWGWVQSFHPHQLIMTATPIHRPLTMTADADLDTSVIDELRPSRTPVTTAAITYTRRAEIIQRVRQAYLQEQRLADWVCTLIEESDVLEAQASETTW